MSNEADLQAAIRAARSGNRDQAYVLFIRLIRQDPGCFPAWLWLSEFGNTLEEQTIALERAQALCPVDAEGRQDLQVHLNKMRRAIPPAAPAASAAPAALEQAQANVAVPVRQTPPPAEKRAPMDAVSRAERLAQTGKREEAVGLLTSQVKNEPQDESAWLLLSELQTDPQEKLHLLERVIAINPQHTAARQRLEALRQIQENPLKRGQSLEEAGEYKQAVSLYRALIVHSRVPTERLEAARRIANIELRQESDQVQPIHPTLNLVRVTLGPVLLFALMIFIQSGLNLVHTPILAVPGIAGVLAGSFLVSVTSMRPFHPQWIALFGVPGSGEEPRMRGRLRLAGWFCMLAPFSIFLIEASFRLGALRASMFQTLP